MRGPTISLVADATAAALTDAVRTWRNEHCRNCAYEGLLETKLKSVDISTVSTRIGELHITVTLTGFKYDTREIYWYHATILAGKLNLNSYT